MQTTPAYSSRVTKSRKPSIAAALGFRRTASSPSSSSPRRKGSSSSTPKLKHSRTTIENDDDEEEKLDDSGVIASLASDLHFRDVPQYMEYIRNKMFSPIPEVAGMNSTRIAELLNYQRNLPPIVSIAHIDALASSSTVMEREISELAIKGILRRVTVPQRGVGSAAVGDGVVLVREWVRILNAREDIDEGLKAKYIALMNANPTSATISGTAFTNPELSILTTTGFLTSPSLSDSPTSLFASPGSGTLSSLSSAGSRHAAGSLAAVGGAEATRHISGGVPTKSTPSSSSTLNSAAHYNFSLPNTGSHIKLLISARTHLLGLLKKLKFKEAPMDALRERWDGGVPASSDAQSKMKRARGEFAGVLPGRTKKWRTFYGMRFEWVLEECVGSGLVECFETGSVGVGVRISS